MEGRVFGARLVGREGEIARLDAVRARAVSGEPATVVIGGEAGVGKSRLVAELRTGWESAGVRWLAGGCIELGDRGLAFAPVVEALRRLVRSTDAEELHGLLGSARAELSRLLPELGVQPQQASTAELSLGPGSEQRRLFELLLGLLERLARSRPVALVLEDLHWADRSTLDLLAFLVRNLRHGRIALVATYRTDELHRRHPLRPFLAELGRSGLVDRIELSRFTRSEVAEQLAGILGETAQAELIDPRFVDDIFSRSDGNAFFVEELVAAGAAGGRSNRGALPEGLRDLLLSRVDRLPEGTQAVLRLAAVGGRRVDQYLLARLAGLPDPQLSAALREAVSHAILVREPEGDMLAFRHALVQEALYADVLPGERSRLHAAFAEALTARAAGAGHPDDTVAAQLASHWLAAHDLPRALPALVEAGMNAESVYAFAEAQRHFEFALELWDRVPAADAGVTIGKLEVLRRAADAAARSGEVDRALALVRAALALVDPDGTGQPGDPLAAGLLHERLGQFLRLAGRDGTQAMREAVRLVPADPPSPERAKVLSALGAALMFELRLDEAKRVSGDAIGIARAAGDRAAEGHARNTLGCVLVMRGQSEEGLAHLRAALATAQEIDSVDHITRAANNLAHSLLVVGHIEEALEVALDGKRIARERGVERIDGTFLSTHVVKALFLLGRWDECARLADEALQLGTGPPDVRTCLRLYRARLSMLRGGVRTAATELERARQEHGVVRDAQDVAMFTEVAAMLALYEGRLEEGLAVTAEGIARVTGGDGFALAFPLCTIGLELEAARAERLRGRPGDTGVPGMGWDGAGPGTPAEPETVRRSVERLDEIRQSAKKLADRLRSLPGPRYPAKLAHLATGAAELSRVLGLADPEGWHAAAAAWDRAGQPYHAAYARWRAAEALVAAAARERAGIPLRSAHVTAVRLGAAPLRAELEQLAARAGIPLTAPPRRTGQAETTVLRAPQGFGLTKRELEVLHLLTMGRTNRQIADTLSINVKTASVHVSNILAKLAVGSRTEAAALASRQGIAAAPAAR